jgi:thiamine transport system permease protein
VGSHQIQGWRNPEDRFFSRIADYTLIALALLLLLPPCWRSLSMA